MLIHPDLEALRGDDSAQRRAQAAMGAALNAWRSTPVVQAVDVDLALWDAGTSLDDLPALSALFEPGCRDAARFAGDLVRTFLAVLKRDRLGQSPLRHYCDDVLSSVTALRHGTTALTLIAIDGHRIALGKPDTSVRFAPTETLDIVLAGDCRAERIRLTGMIGDKANLQVEPLDLRPGSVSIRQGASEAMRFREAPRGLTVLRAQRHAAAVSVTREFALDDGRLLHQAAATPRDSQLELTAALLGRMGRRDAAPLLAAMAEENGSAPMRWQVLRECLALDTEEGFTALCRVAQNPNDPLAPSAGALRAQLIETYPQLRDLSPCHAN